MLYAFGDRRGGDQPQRRPGRHARATCTPSARSARSAAAIAGCRAGAMLGRARAVRHAPGRSRRRKGTIVVFVAGGLGLAPLRPAIYQVLASASGTGASRCCTARAARRTSCFATNSERWRRRLDVEVAVTVDRADPAWRGDVGVVPKLIARAGFDPAQHRRHGLRAGGDDALHRHALCGSRASRRSASICRWSAT